MEACIIVQPNKKLNYEQMMKLIKSANRYQCYIVAKREATEVNMKSLMSLSLIAHFKEGFKIEAIGDDAHDAINHLKQFI